jgi:PLP dependent protein
MNLHQGLSERLNKIRERITTACVHAGRPVDSVKLIAVTKTHPIETLQALIDIGVKDLGENRVQEIVDKVPHLHGHFAMHCIGHLQTNKIARVLPFVQVIQSIDSIRVVEYIEKYLPDGVTLPALVEVNTSAEAAKSGCLPAECRRIIERIIAGRRLTPSGFMTIGPLDGDETAVRKSFSLLRRIAENNSDLIAHPQLSMGMSGDFEWAIHEGSTMVRIGSLLVGGRT